MGRKKGYDEERALEKAMFLFWRGGYSAVSTRNLADEMGINQYSLYASFESKDVLFERSLARYLQAIVVDWLLKPLANSDDGVAAIRSFFEMFVNPGDGTFPAGCFICNTMAEAENPSSEVQSVIDRYQSMLTDSFAGALRHAYPNADKQVVDAKASLLLCALIGIGVKKRNGFHGQPVQQVVDQLIECVTLE